MNEREGSPEDRKKFMAKYWLYVWVGIIFMVLLSTIGTDLRLGDNPYKGHVKFVLLGFIILLFYFLTFYASKKAKCIECQGLYFGANFFNTLRPHKQCSQCKK